MCKKSNTKEFIKKAEKVHKKKYDYSFVNYVNTDSKVKINCKIHGIFEQIPSTHLKGQGCKKCAIQNQIITNESFIKQSNKIHKNKYDYSLTKYVNGRIKVKIICPIHGIFEQIPHDHKRGIECNKCGIKKRSIKHRKTLSEFILQSKKVHKNKYDYSLVEYINSEKYVIIICQKHGQFKKKPSKHLSGQGCKICGIQKRIVNSRKTTKQFIIDSKKIHEDKYDYSETKYVNKNTSLNIICQKHGLFKQNPHDHLSGCGCPFCNLSRGEKKIKTFLENKNLNFVTQKTFKNCIGIKNKLPFDFYLPDYNLCIEFDGKQHYKIISVFGGKEGFEKLQKNDQIKNEYCKNNNIGLIRIPYTKLKKIEEYLNNFLI